MSLTVVVVLVAVFIGLTVLTRATRLILVMGAVLFALWLYHSQSGDITSIVNSVFDSVYDFADDITSTTNRLSSTSADPVTLPESFRA